MDPSPLKEMKFILEDPTKPKRKPKKPPPPPDPKKVVFTPGESRLLGAMMMNVEQDITHLVNWEGVARDLGVNTLSAKSNWYQIRKAKLRGGKKVVAASEAEDLDQSASGDDSGEGEEEEEEHVTMGVASRPKLAFKPYHDAAAAPAPAPTFTAPTAVMVGLSHEALGKRKRDEDNDGAREEEKEEEEEDDDDDEMVDEGEEQCAGPFGRLVLR